MRRRTGKKVKSPKGGVSAEKRELKRVERYTQMSLKGDVVGYFGSPMFHDDIAKLNPKDRVRVFIDLLNYVFPKLQATALADFSTNDPSTREGLDRILELSKRFAVPVSGDAAKAVMEAEYSEVTE